MKKRITVLFLVFLTLFVLMGCGPTWDRMRRPFPKHQSPSWEHTITDLVKQIFAVNE